MNDYADAKNGSTGLDWEGWRHALTRFAAATELCVSAYDLDCERQAGPVASSKVARMLATSGVWNEGRLGDKIERDLAAQVLGTGVPAGASVGEELRLQAVPLLVGGQVRGVIVYGWAFATFGTPLGCERIARQLGVDGARLWAEVRLESPVPESRMKVYTELLETMIESTVRHAEAVERLQELSRLREVFLASVSHELRTPLSVLGMRIEILLRGTLADPETIRASLVDMKHHVNTEARLIEDLIEASRTRTGQLRIDMQPASLRNILKAAISAVVPHAEAKQISVVLPALDELGQLPLVADPHRLQQVFWNLLSNAVKFTPGSGRIELQLHSDAQAYTVSVTDTGSGIEEALLPHVFTPFTKQLKANAQGLGLGLSIARHIVERHGGTIRVESAGSHAGATFHVTLPVNLPPAHDTTA
ncbi:signal transduction histidine kinase [Variovorax boronicumulans]|uniref:sensor histidine kinase n=1 Tax=Variovorax TaxID=34072 RepID=UPI00278769EC|nr:MULTISPECIES: HAMP domain-containing sensor histidine kinase [Variovorax]MDQ0074480.1 signal transduction histidine kinase [Variovorax boronicumulans]MDQ0608112.1 signal transduction histidine kinase [Variovorax sp. W1I1]